MELSIRSRYAINPIQEEDAVAYSLMKAGKEVIKLNRGDPAIYFKTPKYVVDAYVKALREGKTFYADPIGVKELREAVSKRYKSIYNINVNPDSVIVTQGLSEAIIFLNAALINEGEKAVIFKPYYTQYIPDLEIFGGRAVLERYDEKINWNIDIDSLEKSIKRDFKKSNKIKYMLITNPNNPTGTVLDRKVLSDIVEIAKNHDIMLISDEIYDEIVFNGAKFTSISKLANGVPHMILNGGSKDFAATGFRVGFVVVPEEDKVSKAVGSKLGDFAKIRLSGNTPAQYAIAEALNKEREHKDAVRKMVSAIGKRASLVSRLVNESEFMDAVEPKGAFYVFPKLDMKKLALKNDTEFVDKLLKEEYVQLTRGSGFGESNHVRIVALATENVLEDAMQRIERFCRRHSK